MRQFVQAPTDHLGLRGMNERFPPPPTDALQGIFGIGMFDKMPQDGSEGLFHLTGYALFRHAPPCLS
jgi:hypothetical protein